MSNYRRLISYIYAYEGGVKGKNMGFAKIESRGIQCKITVSVKKVYVGSNDIGVYLLAGDQEIFLGNIFIRGGSGEFRTSLSASDVEHSGVTMDECYGLTVHDVENTWRSYTTIWEDAVAHTAEVELLDARPGREPGDEKIIPEERIKKAIREIEEEFPDGEENTETVQEVTKGIRENMKTGQENMEAERENMEAEQENMEAVQENMEAVQEIAKVRQETMEAVQENTEIRQEITEAKPEITKNGQQNAKTTDSIEHAQSIKTPPDSKVKEIHTYQEEPEVMMTDKSAEIPARPDSGGQREMSDLGRCYPVEEQPMASSGQWWFANTPAKKAPLSAEPPLSPEELNKRTVCYRADSEYGETKLRGAGYLSAEPERAAPEVPTRPQSPATPPQKEVAPQPAPQSPQPSAPQPTPQSPQPCAPQPAPQSPQLSAPKAPQPPTQPAQPVQPTPPPVPGNPQDLERLDQNENQEELPHDQVWEKLKREHTKIMAFDYEHGCEILTVKPQDIGILPREAWVYGNNSFLLHGYYNYRYLILARLHNPQGTPRYLLGVPGHYYSNERYMASMFGFPNFVLSKEQPMQDGRFGYWYTDVKLGI